MQWRDDKQRRPLLKGVHLQQPIITVRNLLRSGSAARGAVCPLDIQGPLHSLPPFTDTSTVRSGGADKPLSVSVGKAGSERSSETRVEPLTTPTLLCRAGGAAFSAGSQDSETRGGFFPIDFTVGRLNFQLCWHWSVLPSSRSFKLIIRAVSRQSKSVFLYAFKCVWSFNLGSCGSSCRPSTSKVFKVIGRVTARSSMVWKLGGLSRACSLRVEVSLGIPGGIGPQTAPDAVISFQCQWMVKNPGRVNVSGVCKSCLSGHED